MVEIALLFYDSITLLCQVIWKLLSDGLLIMLCPRLRLPEKKKSPKIKFPLHFVILNLTDTQKAILMYKRNHLEFKGNFFSHYTSSKHCMTNNVGNNTKIGRSFYHDWMSFFWRRMMFWDNIWENHLISFNISAIFYYSTSWHYINFLPNIIYRFKALQNCIFFNWRKWTFSR